VLALLPWSWATWLPGKKGGHKKRAQAGSSRPSTLGEVSSKS